jgi:hypothetical protein
MRMIIVLVRFSMLEVQNLSVNYRIIRALEDVSLGVSSVWGKGQSEMLAPKEKGHQSGHWPKPA